MRFSGWFVQAALSSTLNILNEEVFNYTSVRDIVWGYQNTLVKLGNGILPPDKQLPTDKFGFFAEKNNSVSGEWETMTGLDDVMKVGRVISYNGQEQLDFAQAFIDRP